MDFHEYMDELHVEIEAHLLALFEQATDAPTLLAAMRYSAENGGKRLRPILLLMLLEAFGVNRKIGIQTAIALEMIHTYSLIHDDLPAMDDDALRRGKPTNHKVYGEAVAILAGDGLLTDAFRVLAEDEQLEVVTRLELVRMLAVTAGAYAGMITGQMLDIEAETCAVDLTALKQIHHLKTGRLIEFACLASGIMTKQKDEVLSKLSQFAKSLGLSFQIQDDILDVEGDVEKIGKAVGSDAVKDKSTYVSLLGLACAKEMLEAEINCALETLDELPADVTMLRALTLYVAKRDR